MCGFPEEGNPWIFGIDIYIPEEYDPSTALPEENDFVIVLLRKMITLCTTFCLFCQFRMAGNIGVELNLAVGVCRQILFRQHLMLEPH